MSRNVFQGSDSPKKFFAATHQITVDIVLFVVVLFNVFERKMSKWFRAYGALHLAPVSY